jgi:hypothetical protein
MDRPKLMLVDCMTGKAPQDDPRIVSCVTDDDLITTLVMQDAPPHFRDASAEFLDGWAWMFLPDKLHSSVTTIVMDRNKRQATVSGSVCGIKNLVLTVQEVRTVGLPCSNTRPMIKTEAGVFMLHPQIRAKVGDRLVCSLGCGVVYLSTPTEIPSVQINFGQHWSASQAEVMTQLWNSNY